MDPKYPRIVTRLPLREIPSDAGDGEFEFVGAIGAARIRQLLREESTLSFAVADVGHPLGWIPLTNRFEFWKTEVQPRLVEPDRESWSHEDYPGHYCYHASEWRHEQDGRFAVVLEKYH